ncbi:DUF6978 family protein [Deminuibacter soli]|uniref:Uncharacterized protein n=1 Tax=Deminuibacter soli TaxID=2291815 RepID=A0A3E1ND12_9BACT|nr:hypothetical protein [Deminuibacter soli]RFM25704.1 hypothetical protein DXN05_23630 [Deminuibacter soli]
MEQYLADYLLKLPKQLASSSSTINPRDEKIRLQLISPDDDQWRFIVDITNNQKKVFKISLHHQEDTMKSGLIRVDFNSSHRNPEEINPFVPAKLLPYAGRTFINEPHIHFHVQGYKDLVWAAPLDGYDGFKVKSIASHEQYCGAIVEFTRYINLNGKFVIQQRLL